MKESAGPTIENIPQENLKELSLRLISKVEKYCEQIHGFENLGLFFKDGVESLLENIQRAKKMLPMAKILLYILMTIL